MKYLLFVIIVALLLPTVQAGDFILRPTEECCGSSDGFPVGTRAVLMMTGTPIAETELSKESYLLFENVDPGKYDLLLMAKGYMPIKFIDLVIGSSDVWDFELMTGIRSESSSFLEGQLVIRFRKNFPDQALVNRLKSLGLMVQQTAKLKDSEQPQFEFIRTYEYAEVRVSYDRSEKLTDIIERVLLDQSVIECTPVYFSSR